MLSYLGAAIASVFTPLNFGLLALGVLAGIIVGALPGISGVMGFTLLLPFIFKFEGMAGLCICLGTFCGSVYGGSITAILLNTPGTANSAATALDGYPMATKWGQPGRALATSTISSVIGGTFGAFMLLFTAPLIAKFALKFGPPEYFALAVFGLSMVIGVSGNNVIKGLIMGVTGLFLATVGMDVATGAIRYIFGTTYLTAGISYIPILIGVFAFSQALLNMEKAFAGIHVGAVNVKLERILPTKEDMKACIPTYIRSSLLGTMVGAIPGTGGDIAAWLGYSVAKKVTKNPDNAPFGEGALQGVAAPEAANNAMCGGALIPLLTLGIPGDAGTALMYGVFMVMGVVPGPLLFDTQRNIVYGIIVGLFVGNFIMGAMGFGLIKGFAKITQVPQKFIIPMILVFCFVGTYGVNHNLNDVALMAVTGVISYFLIKHEFPMAPVILGIILGPLAEKNLRRALVLSNGSVGIFFSRPISCVLLIIAFCILTWPLLSYIRATIAKKKSGTLADGVD